MSYHSDMMTEYYAIRESEERQAEISTLAYDTELADYFKTRPRTTFKAFLQERKGNE